MALDVNHPLPSDLHSEHPTVISLDLANDHYSNPHQPSPPPPTTLQRNPRQQPRYYPIFDPPKIKLQQIAIEKAAAMAQYNDKMYAALEANDDSPLSDTIKALAAQFATLCDNESFPPQSQLQLQLQLQHDKISLEILQTEELNLWDTEVAYNSLNYLLVPASSDQPNNNDIIT